MDQISFLGRTPIVIDNGSGIMKAGFAGGQEKPSLIFPSYIGKSKYDIVLPQSGQTSIQLGNIKEESRGLLKLKYPISHGIIQDWKSMDLIWKYIFTELKVNPKECPVFLTEPPLNPYEQKIQTAQIFFESYGVPSFFMGIQGALSLFASGKTSGVVLDVGDGVSHVVPIFEGYGLPHAYGRIDLAGRDVTDHLQLLLRKSGLNFVSSSEYEIVKKIKQVCCFLSITAKSDEQIIDDRKFKDPYILPDGNILDISYEKTRAPEILFSPEKIGLECLSIHQLLNTCIQKTDIDLRKSFYSEIVLAGGSSMITNFPDRLLAECRKITPKDIKIKLHASKDRDLLCWMGGNIFCNLGSFKNMWIMKQDYEEQGERVLLKKTF